MTKPLLQEHSVPWKTCWDSIIYMEPVFSCTPSLWFSIVHTHPASGVLVAGCTLRAPTLAKCRQQVELAASVSSHHQRPGEGTEHQCSKLHALHTISKYPAHHTLESGINYLMPGTNWEKGHIIPGNFSAWTKFASHTQLDGTLTGASRTKWRSISPPGLF